MQIFFLLPYRRIMAPYLSLAAMENAELLALHTQPIIDSVISGNYALAKVLPQIYSVNPDPIKSHIMTLVKDAKLQFQGVSIIIMKLPLSIALL